VRKLKIRELVASHHGKRFDALMTELQILGAAVAGIGLSIWLIVKVGMHPFLALVCGAFILGCLAGLGPHDSIIAMQAGFADVLGGTGPVIALGLILGAILQHSGGARALAGEALRIGGERIATWGSLGAAMLIGIRRSATRVA